MVSYRHYCNVLGDEIYADTELTKWKGHRCYLHTYFDNLKAALDEKKFGHRLFIQYIALILSAQMKNVMDANGWFKSHNMQEVIDEMKSLRVVFMEGKCKQVYTTLTAFQKEIVELFGLVLY